MIERRTAPIAHKGVNVEGKIVVGADGLVQRWSILAGNVNISQLTMKQLQDMYQWTQEDIDVINGKIAQQALY